MKIIHKGYPEINETRLVRKFLFFPKKIKLETRWMEWDTWEEQYTAGWGSSGWDATRWIDSFLER